MIDSDPNKKREHLTVWQSIRPVIIFAFPLIFIAPFAIPAGIFMEVFNMPVGIAWGLSFVLVSPIIFFRKRIAAKLKERGCSRLSAKIVYYERYNPL